MGHFTTPSQREFIVWDPRLDAHNWNLVLPRPINPRDVRHADSHLFFPYNMIVTSECLPPAGVHLSDFLVGQLVQLKDCGFIDQTKLAERWPSTFKKSCGDTGPILQARRPLGYNFTLSGKIAISHTTLLVGGGIYGTPADGKINKGSTAFPWIVTESKPKTLLAPSKSAPTTSPAMSTQGNSQAHRCLYHQTPHPCQPPSNKKLRRMESSRS